jgi:hypothetical protein
MSEEPTPLNHPTSKEDDPIADLQSLIESHGDDVAKLFGPALTIFAGSSAATKDPKQKLA